ncbi:uncharacterized protein LOC132716073 [Ruditapes philippinarum]|uniref:uncharacterized protein LOC132716073 n=1 Tax=Ruditapes philippinarum TaxID=129788 RepID=UPI00295B9366|nr:uncharacterized protein LOC132716073 [Ruditapes philippinarum]
MTNYKLLLLGDLRNRDQAQCWNSVKNTVRYSTGNKTGISGNACARLHTFLSAKQNDKIRQTLLGQYKLAKEKKKIGWMKEFRACVSLHQSDKWMKENIDYRPPTRRQQTSAIPSCTMTKDVRLGTDPSLQVVHEEVVTVKQEPTTEPGLTVTVKQEEPYALLTVPEPIIISDEEPEDRNADARSTAHTEEVIDNLREVIDESNFQAPGDRDLRSPRGLPVEMPPLVDRELSRSLVAQSDLRATLDRKRQKRGSSPPQEASRGKVRLKSCVIASCKSMFCNIRRHAMEKHLPKPFQENALADSSLHNKRIELLMFLKCKVLGEKATFSDLLRWVDSQRAMSVDTFVPDTDFKWLEKACSRQRWRQPRRFSLVPINCEALLFHWRVLLVLLNHVTEEERLLFKQGNTSNPITVECSEEDFQVVDSVGFEDNFSMASPSNDLEAFDSHFHADRLSKVLYGNPREAVADLIKASVGVLPTTSVKVIGGVMVFCDPETFPETLPSERGFGSAVGVHPKKCHLLSDSAYQKLLSFLMSCNVVALGEIGLDRTEPEMSWDLQEKTMVRLLQFSMPVRPVILHMRDGTDQHAGEVSAKCLQIMKANTAPTQKIHLHSFGGTVEQVVGWLEAFPNCYFGFSDRVTYFDKYQVAALQRVPDNRLLLETDAPYFKKNAAKASTPAFLGDIGDVVSKHRGTSLPETMRLTTRNGQDLYSL